MRPPRRRTLAVGLTASALVAATACALVAEATGLGADVALRPIVRGPVAAQLAALGFSDARFEVERVGWREIRLADLHVGGDLVIGSVELETDEGGLVGGRVTSVTIDGARWTTSLDAGALRDSSLARLLAAGDAGDAAARGAPPRIRIERSVIVIERDGGDALTLEIDGDVAPAEPRALFAVRSSLGAHSLSAVGRQRDGEIAVDASIRSTDGGGDALDASFTRAEGAGAPIAWRLTAGLAGRRLASALRDVKLEGRVTVDASGIARPASDAASASSSSSWTLEDVALTAKVGALTAPAADLRLERPRVALRLGGTIAPDGALALELDERSHARAERVQLGDWRAERVELAPSLRIEHTPGSSLRALVRAPIEARVGELAVGAGEGELRAERAVLTIASHEDRALLEVGAGVLRGAMHVEGRAPRLAGALRGRDLRASGDLDAALGAGIDAPLRIEIAHVREPESGVALRAASLDLRIAHDERGEVRALGRMRARSLSWGAHALGAPRGSVEIGGERVDLAWRTPMLALSARIGLERGDGSAHVDVPSTVLRAGDPLHEAVREATGLAITGRADGELQVNLRRPDASRARVRFAGATVENFAERSRATGVHGRIELARVEPIASAGTNWLRWTELTLGDLGTFGPGSARVRFERSGEVSITDAVSELAGGVVRVGPVRFDPEAPDLALDLAFDGVGVERVLALITRGRATGTGRLDGRLALRVVLGPELRVVLGRGRLAARGNGRIVVPGGDTTPRSIHLDGLRTGEWLEERVLAALRNFEYSRLVLDLVGDEGRKRVIARVSGRGTRIPQEIDLVMSVRGIQPAVDEALRLSSSMSIQ